MYTTTISGTALTLETLPTLFSPGGSDKGTLAMLSQVELQQGQRLLDLGCGAGIVAIYAAKALFPADVYATDFDPDAVACARKNAVRNEVDGIHFYCGDALENVDATGFDWILSNPPYHADFSVAKKFIEKGFNRLKVGGKLVMVVKRELWYKNKLTAVFGGVTEKEIDGYFVFTAQKRGDAYAPKKPKAAKTPPSAQKKKAPNK